MEPATVSSCILTLHRRFAAYTTQRLQELGLSFGMMYFIIYVGKHPGCTPSELTQRLHLDWGHSQRSLTKLAEDGFLTKEKSGRSYHLELTEKGRTAFAACHRVFYGWDAKNLTGLTADEQRQLLDLLQKAAQKGSM
jgi:DNA-binding MarR family transcriptional regulator